MEIIHKYFPDLTENQLLKFKELKPLYYNWNEKINVISRKDIDQLYIRHVLHSLAIAKVFKFEKDDKVLDVGTGGGFPGIPLAIIFPHVKFHLIDSIAKKIKVVHAVKKELGLTNVTEEQLRVENSKTLYNHIVSRAVTNFPDFVKLSRKKLIKTRNSKIIYLKGGDFSEEIAPYKNKIELFDINDFFEEDFFETKKIIIYSPFN